MGQCKLFLPTCSRDDRMSISRLTRGLTRLNIVQEPVYSYPMPRDLQLSQVQSGVKGKQGKEASIKGDFTIVCVMRLNTLPSARHLILARASGLHH